MRPCGPEPHTRERSMPASDASRRASGVTSLPPGSFAGPIIALGRAHLEERIELDGGCVVAGGCRSARPRSGAGWRARGRAGAPLARAHGGSLSCQTPQAGDGRAAPPPRSPPPPRRPAPPRPRRRGFPRARRLVVDGTSIDTLSVSISNRLSPGFTASPADLNHLVILPSATVSPSCGIRTSMNQPL